MFEPSIAIEAWSNLLDIIYDLAKQKPWLREECGFVLSSSIQILRQKDSKFSQLLLDKLQLNGLSKTPEGIALWIAVQSKTPALDFPPNVWHRDDPLHRKEISKLAEILREGPIIDPALNGSDLKATQKGSWNTKLNFAWDVILAELLDVRPAKAKKGSKDRKRISFADFWEQCIESKWS